MKYRLTIILVLIFGYLSVFAEDLPVFTGNINEIINNVQRRREQIIQQILKEKNNFAVYQRTAVKYVKTYQKIVNGIKEQHIKNHQKIISNTKKHHVSGIRTTTQAIVFVSFSMPDLSLKQIMQDAVCYKIPVVIRGLHHNSFKDTVAKIYSLIKEDNKGGILINPRWFKEYKITAVPAVIVSDGNSSNVIYGNIPLKRALSLIVEQGRHNIAKVAQNILQSGGI